jgi:hypothetical protein
MVSVALETAGIRVFGTLATACFQSPCHAGSRDFVSFRELSQAQPAGAVADQGCSVDLNWLAAQSLPFKSSASESGPNTFDNEVTF